jgi:fibronectin-binding autotransporter adhesin
MHKQKPQKRELLAVALWTYVLRAFAICTRFAATPVTFVTKTVTGLVNRTPVKLYIRAGVLTVIFALVALTMGLTITGFKPAHTAAATSSTLNFQARLMSIAGSVAADGNYNIEFKLYSAVSGGTAEWTETRTNASTTGVTVRNGYVTVNLGSVTAFPSTIDWSQQQWLTMNIGGTSTGAVTWDGEMSPRLQLTAVPYAFRAAQAAQLYTTNGSFTSTLNLLGPTVGNQTFNIPDQGAAGTYTLLTTNTANTNYIQNSTGGPQTANFNIQATSSGVAGTVGGVIRGASGGQTADLLDFQASGGAVIGRVTATGGIATNDVIIAGATSGNLGQLTVLPAAVGTIGETIKGFSGQTADLLQVINSSSSVLARISATGVIGSGDTNTASTASGNTVIQSGNATGTTSNSGNVTIDAGTATGTKGQVQIGVTNASSILEGRSGITTTNQGAVTVNQLLTAGGGLTVNSGSLFTNSSPTLFTSTTSLGDFPTGGSIGLASATVDVSTTLTLTQTTAGQTITIPSPTSAAAGRLVYLTNRGSASVVISNLSLNLSGGNTTTMLWNGIAWTAAGTSSNGNYIINGTTVQPSTNFNISTTGQAGVSFLSPLFDTVSGGTTLSVGTGNATAISIGKAGVTTTNGGPLTVTGLTTANGGLTVSGATNINTSGANTTNIGTGGTGAVNIGVAGAATTILGTVGINNSGTATTTIGFTGGTTNVAGTTGFTGATTITGTANINNGGTAATNIGNATGALTVVSNGGLNATAAGVITAGTYNGQTITSAANFTGTVAVATSLSTPIVTTASGALALNTGSAAAINIGGGSANAVNLSQNTSVATSKTFTVTNGATSLTGGLTVVGNTTINTTASNGTTNIGNASNTLQLSSNAFNLSTAGAITGVTGYTQASGNATFNQAAATSNQVLIQQAAGLATGTTDQFVVDNTNFTNGQTNAGVNNVNLKFKGSTTTAVENGSLRIDLTPGTFSGSTTNGVRVVSSAGALTGATQNALKIDGITASVGTNNAINIGTNWTNLLTMGATSIINGAGVLQNVALNGTYTNALTLNNASNVIWGNGANLTALNGTQVTTGTVADARLSSNVALYNAAVANFTGTLQMGGSTVCVQSGSCVAGPTTLFAGDYYFQNGGNSISGVGAATYTLGSMTGTTNSIAIIVNGVAQATFDNSNVLTLPSNEAIKQGTNTVLSSTGVLANVSYQGSVIGAQYGGTGAGTFTQYGVIYGNGASTLGVTGAGTTGQCLISTTGSAPVFGSCAGSGSGATLQAAYNNDVAASPDIVEDSTRTTVDIQGYSGQAGDLLALRQYVASGLGTRIFGVDVNGNTNQAGSLTVASGGASITGGLNLNTGNVTNGGTYNSQTISATAAFTGTVSVATSLQTPALNVAVAGGTLTTNIGTFQHTATGTTAFDLNDTGVTTFQIKNSGAGTSNLDLLDGNLTTNGTQRLSNAGALSNITGYTQSSGNATYALAAGNSVALTASATPTGDLFTITNTSATNAPTANNIDAQGLTYFVKPGTGNTEAVSHLTVTNSNTTTGGQAVGLHVTATGAGGAIASDTVGLQIDTLGTPSTGTTQQNAIEVGTGWNNILSYQGVTTLIDGTGHFNLNQVINTLGIGNGGTGLNTTPTNGQLLIGNGAGYTLGTIANNGGLTVSNGVGTIGLAVNYGSAVNTAAQGNTSIGFTGTGNLTGSLTGTAGGGFTANTLNTVQNPTFTTSVTSPIFTGTGAVTLSSGGTSDLTLQSGSGNIVSNNQVQRALTRTIPTTVNNEVDLGSFAFTNGGGSLYISVTVPSSSFSLAKEYNIPVAYNATAGVWQLVAPISDTGAFSGTQDVSLEINVNNGTASLRLRRSLGTTAGTAQIVIIQQGINTDAFTPSITTSSVVAPTVYYNAAVISQVGGDAVIQGDVNISTAATGALKFGGTTVIDSSRILQNIASVSQTLLPTSTTFYDLGSAAATWKTGYFGTGGVLTPLVDTVTAGTLSIGTSTANAITIGKVGVTTTVGGPLTSTGLVTANGGLTVAGATNITGATNINTSGANTTNISTGGTGALNLGNTGSALTIASSGTGLNVTSAGVVTAGTYNGQTISSAAVFTGTLQFATLGATNTATQLCRNTSNQLAACNTTGTGAAFVQGGNAFGAQAVLGTTDSNSLAFRTNTSTKLVLDTAGSLQFQQASTISTSAGILTIQPASGSNLALNSGTAGGTITTNAGTIQSTQAGTTTIDLSNASATTLAVDNSGAGVASLNIVSGDLQTGGTVKLTNAGVLQNITGLTVTGATTLTGATLINNNAGTNTTGIGTGTTTGQITIGNIGAPLVIASSGANGLNVTSAGVVTAGTYNGQTISSAAVFTGTLQFATLGATNTATLLCRNSSNQLAACNTTGTGAAFIQGGNAFGAQAVLGTTDANSLAFRTNTTTKAVIDTTGNLQFQQASTISTSTGALTIQPAAGNNLALNSGTAGGTVTTNAGTIQRTAAGTTTIDLNDSGTTILKIFNSGTGVANLNLFGGDLTTTGSNTVRLTNAGGLTNITSYSQISGSSAFAQTAAADHFTITNNQAAPTNDILNITNSVGITSAGKNALSINYVGGAAAVESAAQRIDLQPGTTSGGVWSGLRIVQNTTAGPVTGVTANGIKLEGPTTAGAGNYNAVNINNIGAVTTGGIVTGLNISGTNSQTAGTIQGININNLTSNTATANAITIGTGWTNILTAASNVLINGSGLLNAANTYGFLPDARLNATIPRYADTIANFTGTLENNGSQVCTNAGTCVSGGTTMFAGDFYFQQGGNSITGVAGDYLLGSATGKTNPLTVINNGTSEVTFDASGNVNILNGALEIAGTSVITHAGVLQNVTADTGILTSGTLGVARGGTGAATFTQYGVIYGNNATNLSVTAAGTTGQCLVATTSAAPTWQTCAGAGSGAANQALSNLSAVAINTSLLPGVTNSINAGSPTFTFANGYFGTSIVTPSITTAGATALGIDTGGVAAINIGTTNASVINLNQNTSVATGQTLTVVNGLTSLTGGLTVSGTTGITGVTTINTSGANATTIGNAGATVAIASSGLNVTTLGVVSGVTGYTQTSGTTSITSAATSGNVLSVTGNSFNTTGANLGQLTFKNANATATATTVNGLSIGASGTASGANTINSINLQNVTTIAGNTFNGINAGTGYNSILDYNNGATIVVNGTGQLNLASTFNQLNIASGTNVSGILAAANGGTGVNASAATNGQLLIGNGGGVQLGNITSAAGSITVTNSAGAIGLAVVYGSAANTAAQGSQSLTFTGAGNLTGTVSGTSGGGITSNTLAIISNPSFTGTVASSNSSGVGLAASGTPTASATVSLVQLGSAIASGNAVANGGTYIGLNEPAAGAGSAADFLNFQVGGTFKLKVSNTGVVNSATGFQIASAAALGNYLRGDGTNFVSSALQAADLSGTVAVAHGGTGVTTAPTNGQILVGSTASGNYAPTTIASTGLTVTGGANSLNLSVAYGAGAGNAVQGNTTIVFANGTNVTGGTTITLGTGGTVTLGVANNPSFTGLVTASSAGTGLAVTGAPAASATASQIQIGAAIAGGNAVANGGTYIGLNEPAAGAGSAADFLNFQVGGTFKLKVSNTGVVNSATGFQIASAAALGNYLRGDGTNFVSSALLTSDLSGQVTVANGGTGVGTLTQFGVLYGNATGNIQASAVGATGQCLIGNTSAAPTWGSCTSGSITGSGTANTLPIYTGTGTTLGNSIITQNSTTAIGIGTSGTPASLLSVGGTTGNFQVNSTGQLIVGTIASGFGTISTTNTIATTTTVTGSQLISSVASGTAPLAVTSTTLVSNLNSQYLNGYTESQLAENIRSNVNITGGGTSSYDGTNVKWTSRYDVIANGNGADFSTSGFFDITMPTSGTVTGVGGATSVTATASGIPLANWTALYYIMPIGSASTSLPANFRVATYTSALSVPSNWVLIALHNGDNNTVRFGIGITLATGQSSTNGSWDNAIFGTSTTTPLLTTSGATALNVYPGGAAALNLGTTNANAVTLGRAAASLAIASTALNVSTAGVITGVTGYTQNSGNTTINQSAADIFTIQATAVPTTDSLQISNSGFPVTANDINAQQIDYFAAPSTSGFQDSALHVNITNTSAVAGATTSALRVTATGAVASNTNGILIDNFTAGAGTATGINIGTGWTNSLTIAGNVVFNATGKLQDTALTGTYSTNALTFSNAGNSYSGTWNGNTVSIAKGGTNATTIGVVGTVPYSTGTAYGFTAAPGSNGLCLSSNTAGAPTWAACSTGSLTGAGTANFVAKFSAAGVLTNSQLFDNGTNVGVGVSGTPSSLLSVGGTTGNFTINTSGAVTAATGLTFTTGATRTISVGAAVSGNPGDILQVVAGNGTGTNMAGGNLILQAGLATGTGTTGNVIVRPQTGGDSTTAFQIQNAAGTTTILKADTAGTNVTVNNPTAATGTTTTGSDTFNTGGPALPAQWTFLNGSADASSTSYNSAVAGKLRITASPTTTNRDCWTTTLTCLRAVETAPTADFTAVEKIDSIPPVGATDIHFVGMILETDSSQTTGAAGGTNILRFEVQAQGNVLAVYDSSVINGVGTSGLSSANITGYAGSTIYLKVVRTGDNWTTYYSPDNITYTSVGSFTQPFVMTGANAKIGMAMSTTSNNTNYTTADFDTFNITTSTTTNAVALNTNGDINVSNGRLIIGGNVVCDITGCGVGSGGVSGANQALSNLSTTSINTDLNFASGATRTLSIANPTTTGAGNNIVVMAASGFGTNQNGGDLLLQSGAATGSGTAGHIIARPQTDSTTGFQVQNAAATSTYLGVNTTGTGNVLSVGSTSAFTINNSGTVTAGTWNGTAVDVAHGGTGAATFTAHGVLLGQGTTAITAVTPGTSGFCLTSQGAAADPIWLGCTTGGGGSPTGAAGGDLGSTYPNPTVVGIQTKAVTITSLATNNTLQYNGTAWVNGMLTSSNLTTGAYPAITSVGTLSSLAITNVSASTSALTVADSAYTTNNANLAQLTFSNANASATATTVNGVSITPTGATNGNANANILNALNLPNVTTIANNAFYGLNVGTGYNAILRYNGTSVINGTGQLVIGTNTANVGIVGSLSVTNGGTGATTFTSNGVLYGAGTGSIVASAASTAANQCLTTTGIGTAPVWGSCTAGGGGSPTGAAGGDLGSTYPNPTVVGIQTKAVTITSLATNNTLIYNGTVWVNSMISNGSLASGSFGNITGVGTLGTLAITDVSASTSALTVADSAYTTNGANLAQLTFSNANASATATTVNGVSITPTGATNANANANILNALNLPNVTTIANNAFYGLNVGTGYNAILRYNGTSVINGTGQLVIGTNTANVGIIGSLSVTNGGTGAATIGALGTVPYSTGTVLGYTATPVSTGLCLFSNTAGAPTWSTCAAGANVTLSNLGTTAINADLTFATGGTRTLSVAAAASGNAGNILKLQAGNGTGTNQAGGNLLLQPGLATGTGVEGAVIVKPQSGGDAINIFQVQNASSSGNLTVDTLNNQVNIGSIASGGITQLFFDGFESGSFSQWIGPTTAGTGTMTVQTSTVHAGSYAAKVITGGGTATAYASLPFSTGTTSPDVSAYVNFSSYGASGTGSQPIFSIDTTTSFFSVNRDDVSGNLCVYDGYSATEVCSTTLITAGTGWHRVELFVNTVAGTWNLFMDGSSVKTGTGTYASAVANQTDLGNSAAGRVETVYVDDVTINSGTTGTAGVTTSLNVGGSLTVAGTSNFNGQVQIKPANNSTTAFQIQNAASGALLTADTVNGQITTENLNVGSAANLGAAGRLFSDSFEGGNTALWDTTTGAAVDTTQVHNGKYSLKLNPSSSVSDVVKAVSPVATMDTRGYFYATTNTTTGSPDFMSFGNSVTGATSDINVFRDSSTNLIKVWYNGGNILASAVTYPLSQWNKIEVKVLASTSATGTIQVWLNGTLIINGSGLNTVPSGVTTFNSVRLGDTGSTTQTMWADDYVADIQNVGDSSNLNVADTLSVAGSTLLHGNVLLQATSNSTTAFQIQTSAAAAIFTGDTSNNRIVIGSGATGTATPTILVLDNSTTNGDPTGVNGAMYYNTLLREMRCYIDGGWSNCTGMGPEYQDLQDDFLGQCWGQDNYSGLGDTNWTTYSTTAQAYSTITQGTAVANHPGICTLTTLAGANGTGVGFAKWASSYSDVNRMVWVFQIPNVTTVTVRLGIMTTLTVTGQPTDGAYLQLSSANTHFRAVTRNGGVETNTDTGITAVNNTWYQLELRHNAAGNWEYYLNGTLVSTNTTNLPTGTAEQVTAQLIQTTGSTAERDLNLDYWRMSSRRLVRY